MKYKDLLAKYIYIYMPIIIKVYCKRGLWNSKRIVINYFETNKEKKCIKERNVYQMYVKIL